MNEPRGRELYSTASYQAQNLAGIGLDGNNLAGWNLAGQNLSAANLSYGTSRAPEPEQRQPAGRILERRTSDQRQL